MICFLSDVNECVRNLHNCHVDGYCDNIKGSFYCTCHIGYSGDGVTCSGKYTECLNLKHSVCIEMRFSTFLLAHVKRIKSINLTY